MKRTLRTKTPRIDPSEHQLQAQLVAECAYKLKPNLVLRAIPNGGLRNARVAMSLKAEGVRRGTPDTFVCLPKGRVGWLEMKAKKGVLSDEQIGFRTAVEKLDHLYGVAHTVQEAFDHLQRWGALREQYCRDLSEERAA